MSKAKLTDALTDGELDRLGTFLGQFPGAMNLEAIDGFFSALICAPRLEPMGEVLSLAWGDEVEFASDAEANETASLLMRHWNTISRGIDRGIYFPVLLEDEAGKAYANDWAQGFKHKPDDSRPRPWWERVTPIRVRAASPAD